MTVGSGGAAVPLELGEPLRSRVLDPDLDKYRRIDPRASVNTSLDTIAGGIPDDIRADYLACYEGDRYVESMRYVRSVPRGAARARRAAAADHHAGHDRQRPPRPRRTARQRGVPRRAAAQQPARGSSTPATSPGRRRRRSTPRSSSSRSTGSDSMTVTAPTGHATRGDPARRGSGIELRLPPFRPPRASCRWCCCSTSAATSTTGTRH